VHLLDNPIRAYAWGSRTALAALLGHEPTDHPEAELWIGAHAGDPSRLPDGRRLDEEIHDRALPILGPEVAGGFGGRLPFLMKVIAVDEVLSLQVHPSSEQARSGHAREEAAGIPLDAPHRSYGDPWHKPELVLALTPFETLAGFRDVPETTRLLGLLDVPWAAQTVERLEQEGDPTELLKAVVADTLRLPHADVAVLIGELTAAAGRVGDAEAEDRRVFEILAQLASRYPDDPAVLVALLLNDVVLEPGDAMYVAPGVVHAHGSGLAVEIMAASDNVLRAGLTAKHRDVEELLAISDFTPGPPPVTPPSEYGATFARFTTSAAEFELFVGKPPLPGLPATGPRILLALDGEVEVRAGGETQQVPRGRAVFLEHDDGPVTVTGDAWVALGGVPPLPPDLP
jgi:mannose-6-phosphate isomerase